MSRIRIALVAALSAALVIVATATAAPIKLSGVVGPGFTITLKKGTAKVTKLKAGKYTLVVKDLSSAHNFDLKNPKGKSVVKTSVSATGTKTYTVTLTKGTWRFVCDPHSSFMKGSFTVS